MLQSYADVARGHRALGQRRRRRLAGVAGTVAVGAAAVVLAVVPAPRAAAPARPAAQASAANSKLVTLATRISASAGSQPGNASLEIVKETIGGKLVQVYYGLYTDAGKLYSGDGKQTLMMAPGHGLTAGQAIAAAGSVARDFLDIHPAGDIVTYDEDPREDPGVLASPAAVVVRGVRVR